MDPTIKTRGLGRSFGSTKAVDGIDLDVRAGEVFGYLGLNGAGKTTTIKMLATLLKPTAGRASVAGYDVQEDPLRVRASIGLVGDEGGESRPSWTAREYLGYFATVRGLPVTRGHLDTALSRVGLDASAGRRAMGNLSTGMRRRVEIARALIGSPTVLFLDEPTRGLDLPAKRETWTYLRRLAKDEGVTIFLSSHEVPEIQALCMRLAVVSHGRIAYQGPSASLGRDSSFEASLVRLLQATPQPDISSRPKPR